MIYIYYLALSFALLFSLPGFVSAQDITSGLIGHWKFDEGSGTTAGDSSGNNNTGTLTNGSTWTTGKIGGAVSFDGSNDYINVPHNNVLNFGTADFTVSLWANPQTFGGTLIGKYGTTGDGWRMYTSGRLIFDANGGERYSNSGIMTNQWQLFTIVQTANGMRLYVNGVDQTNYGPRVNSIDNTVPLTIGTVTKPPIGDCCQRYANAIIDDARIYNRALSVSDISALYALGASSPPPTGDAQAPTAPTNLIATTISSSQINLSWTASTDNVGVTGYRVERCQGSGCTNFTQIATPTGTTYSDTNLTANTTYRYQVRATDAANNLSGYSNTASATTQAAPPPGSSALATLAASMAPGTWAELTTNNIVGTLGNVNGATGMILPYSNDMVWDPGSRQLFFIGADHLAPEGPQFVSYTDLTNTWQRLSRPSWLSSLTWFHGFDHSAMNEAAGTLFHRPYGINQVYKYNIAAQTWTSTNAPYGSDYANCCDALEYFPGLGLVWTAGNGSSGQNNGHMYLYNDMTSQWSVLSSSIDLAGTWHVAEYNPVHNVLIFFSSQTSKFYKLSSSGQITTIANPPVSLYDGTMSVGTLTADPVSGEYIMLSPASRQMYTYDVPTNTWQSLSVPTKPNLTNYGVVAAPVSTYGVIVYAACYGSSTCRTYLYKHSSSITPLPDTTLPSTPTNLSATAVSSSQINLSWTASTDNVGVTGYRVERCQGAGCTTFTQIATSATNAYSDIGLSANITYQYRVRATDAAGNLSSYSSVASATTQAGSSGGVNPILAALGDNTSIDLGVMGCQQPAGDLTPCTEKLAYSSWTYNPNDHTVVAWGGGHASTMTDAVGIFHFDTLTWAEPYAPTPCSSMTAGNYDSINAAWLSGPSGPYPRPVSRHTYDLVAIPNGINDLIVMAMLNGTAGSPCVFANQFNLGRVAHYHFASNTWEFTNAQTDANPDSGSNTAYGSSEYDPVSGKILLVSGYGLHIYDPIAKTKTRYIRGDYGEWRDVNGNPMRDDLGYDNDMVYYPPNGYFYYFARGNPVKVFEIRPDRSNWSNTRITLLTTNGLTSTTVDSGPGYAYDSVNQVIGGGTENGNFHIFDPNTRTWTRMTPNGPNMGLMHNKAAAYDPINNVFLVKASTNTGGHVFAYRYKKTSSSPPPSDTQNPSIPAGLTAITISSSQINLSWTGSTDNVGVTGYRVEWCQGSGCTNFTQIGTPTSTSFNDTGLSANITYQYRVRAADAAGNLSSYSSIASATTQASTSPPSGGSDFATRCSAPGVVRCYGFDDPNDFTNTLSDQTKSLHLLGSSGGGPNRFTWDGSIKASGNYSMRVDSPAQANADCCGSVFINISNNYNTQFGAGETFYMQERQRYSSGFLGQWFQTGGGGTTGAKLMWVGEGDQPGITTFSCTEMESVTSTDTGHPILGGQYGFPGFYHGCGRFIGLDFYDGVQVRMQRQGPPYCYYPNDPQRGCFPLYANEWMTFKYRIQIGAWNTPSSRVQVWAAREGQPSIMIFDSNDAFPPTSGNPGGMTLYNLVDCAYTGNVQPCAGGSGTYPNAKFGKIWFSPYMTNRAFDQTTVGGINRAFSVWYDDLIISRNDIADPGTTPPPTTLLGDLNGDRTVNNFDWNIMAGVWFTNDPTADINKDGIVNTADYYYIYANWGKSI